MWFCHVRFGISTWANLLFVTIKFQSQRVGPSKRVMRPSLSIQISDYSRTCVLYMCIVCCIWYLYTYYSMIGFICGGPPFYFRRFQDLKQQEMTQKLSSPPTKNKSRIIFSSVRDFFHPPPQKKKKTSQISGGLLAPLDGWIFAPLGRSWRWYLPVMILWDKPISLGPVRHSTVDSFCKDSKSSLLDYVDPHPREVNWTSTVFFVWCVWNTVQCHEMPWNWVLSEQWTSRSWVDFQIGRIRELHGVAGCGMGCHARNGREKVGPTCLTWFDRLPRGPHGPHVQRYGFWQQRGGSLW